MTGRIFVAACVVQAPLWGCGGDDETTTATGLDPKCLQLNADIQIASSNAYATCAFLQLDSALNAQCLTCTVDVAINNFCDQPGCVAECGDGVCPGAPDNRFCDSMKAHFLTGAGSGGCAEYSFETAKTCVEKNNAIRYAHDRADAVCPFVLGGGGSSCHDCLMINEITDYCSTPACNAMSSSVFSGSDCQAIIAAFAGNHCVNETILTTAPPPTSVCKDLDNDLELAYIPAESSCGPTDFDCVKCATNQEKVALCAEGCSQSLHTPLGTVNCNQYTADAAADVASGGCLGWTHPNPLPGSGDATAECLMYNSFAHIAESKAVEECGQKFSVVAEFDRCMDCSMAKSSALVEGYCGPSACYEQAIFGGGTQTACTAAVASVADCANYCELDWMCQGTNITK